MSKITFVLKCSHVVTFNESTDSFTEREGNADDDSPQSSCRSWRDEKILGGDSSRVLWWRVARMWMCARLLEGSSSVRF